MNSSAFVKVFDVANSGFKDWEFSAFGLIFVFAGTVIFLGPRILKAFGVPYLETSSTKLTLFRYLFLGFAVFWTLASFVGTYRQHLRHQEVAANGCKTVEGRIKNFAPMPAYGHTQESFEVQGTRFRYSDYIVTDAFNNTASHGGPISRNAYVRICYDPLDHAILRLEIRGFRGKAPDYFKGDNAFESGVRAPYSNCGNGCGVRNQNHATWPQNAALYRYGPWVNAWVIFYFLDTVFTLAMALPYIRLFLTLKRTPTTGLKLPLSLRSGRKIKLRNNLALWDSVESALWIRARGFNFFRTPLVVARFEVDPTDDAIKAEEIRLSIGAVFVFLMFAVGTAFLFSLSFPDKAHLPVLLSVIFIFFSVAAFLGVKRFQRRMEELARDAKRDLAALS